MRKQRRAGFSLVELVVVIVIIGIIAAMAIPRLSRGSAGASDSSLMGNLAIVRSAINLYAAEHNNVFPSGTAAEVDDKLTMYSSGAGATNATRSAIYKFGPYLVAMPPCPVGNKATPTVILIDSANSPPAVDAGDDAGWVYNPTTGEIVANTADTDQSGKAYNTY